MVDFGAVSSESRRKMVGGGILNVEDINVDRQDEFVYSRKDMLCVYDVQGKLLLEKCWENAELISRMFIVSRLGIRELELWMVRNVFSCWI